MASRKPETSDLSDGISLQSVILQFSLMCAVLYFWSSPFIHPVKIMVVLFHEMGHGLMALLTGGKVLAISIAVDEGGGCQTEGGLPLLIVSAGYLGSMFFGGVILYLSRFRVFVPMVYGILTLMLISATFTVLEGSYSKTFAGVLATIFIFLGFLTPVAIGGLVLRAIGTVSCVYSIYDIYWDILARHGTQAVRNDAVIFSDMSGIPAQSIGMAWLAGAIVFFLFVLRLTVKVTAEESAQMRGAAA